MEYQGLGYVDAVKDLAESAGIKMPEYEPRATGQDSGGPDLYEIMERATGYYREQLKVAPQAIDYLKGRGLTGAIAARFGIGYAPAGWQNLQAVFSDYGDKALKDAGLVIDAEEGGRRYDRFRDRIMFPILNQRGSVIGFGGRVLGAGEPKYLNSPETSLFEKGRELYGLSQARSAIRTTGRALVVEGYMDVVALAQHGIEFSVATLGTATSGVHVQKLFRQTDEIVFCFDGDAAGRRAAWHALEVSLAVLADNKAVRFLFLPQEDDPDSYVRAHGAPAFEAMLAEARPLSEFLLLELQRRVDMGTLEGRSRLIAEAKPLLKRIAAPALQLQLLKQLGAAADMTYEQVGTLTDIRTTASIEPRRNAPPSSGARVPAEGALEQLLLRCVLNQPRLALELPLDLLDVQHASSRALVALAEFASTAPDASGALIIEHFISTAHARTLIDAQANSMGMQIEGEDQEIEFRDALQCLEDRRARGRIKVLEKKINAGEVSDAEKAEYNRLSLRSSH
ncbi:MAG: DNA primase [Betaproteobacteria bacterium RIFCSPLOWO2_02_FULL_62_17]|nr:MAG: DNA primase [Betaproteobacteria bacterium RIFCSPLOWO2_02_FULL_62_17]